MSMNYILAMFCACITGVAIGIGIHHNFDDKSPVVMTGGNSTFSAITVQSDNGSSPDPVFQEFVASENFDAVALSQMQAQLQQLLAQQDEMKNHQSELNREINAIQFRLDTHSESFRPLRSERDTQTVAPTPPQGLSPLLPPLR